MPSVGEAMSLPPKENIQPNTISSQQNLNVTSVPKRQTQSTMKKEIVRFGFFRYETISCI